MNFPLRARVAATMCAGLILLCAAGVVFNGRLSRFLDTEDSVERAQEVLKTAQLLLTSVTDVETAQRAYVLTGDLRYSRRYRARLAAVSPAFRRLRRLTADSPSQQRRLDALDSLITAKLEWMAKLGGLREEEGFPSALKAFRTGRGTALMDDIRRLFKELLAEEEATLASRQELSRDDARGTIRTMALLILSALLLGTVSALSIDRSIRQRTEAEAAMTASEQRLSSLLEAAPDPIIIAGEDGRIVLANAQAEKTFGYAKLELIGRSVESLIPERFRSAHAEHRAGYARSPSRRMMGTGRDLYARRKDASEFPADITLSPLKTEQGVWAIAIVRDTTEQRSAQEAVRAGQERLDLALESAKMGAWELDLRTDRSVRTLRHDQIFGYETMQPEWGVGRFMQEHVSLEHKPLVDRAFTEAFKNGVFRLECPITRKDGAGRWILCEGRVFRDARGEPARLVGIVTDVTEHKAKEDELARANAQLEASNKELESFSYSVSHDLRAPLRSIDGFSQAVVEDSAGSLSGESLEHLARVRAASQRMAGLIDDLLNLSRITRAGLRRARVDLSALAAAVAKELAGAEPGRDVAWSIQPGLFVDADEGLMRIVLQNCLGNAWKFTSKTARARIEFSSFRQPDGTPAYCVRDNGAGFDPAYAHKLFGAFQRLHDEADYPGTGVGLATIQRIAHRHGGRVWAEGSPGRGATIYFTIPEPAERTS